MDCQTLDEKLYEYEAGTLDAATRSGAEAHVVACPHCARELADYRETVRLIATTKHPEMPESFWTSQRERVMAVVRRALEIRPWQAPPLSLMMLMIIVAGYVFAGFDSIGSVAQDVNLSGDREGSTVYFTLIPLYAFMLVMAGLTFRDRPEERASGASR